MLDWDWRELPKIGVEALLERFNVALYAPRAGGAGIRPICFARRTVSPCGLSERPNAQRPEEARARITTLCGGRWSQLDSYIICALYRPAWPEKTKAAHDCCPYSVSGRAVRQLFDNLNTCASMNDLHRLRSRCAPSQKF